MQFNPYSCKEWVTNLQKIIFLGTGGDAIVVGKQLLASGGIVVQVDDNQFHIDPGPGALVKAHEFNVNPRNNTAVIATHAHVNHCSDLNAVINAMSLAGMDVHGVVIVNETIIEGDEKHSKMITHFHKGCVEKVIDLSPGQRIGINNVEIIGTFAKHNDKNALGIKLITPYFSLGYSGDTGIDILVLNVQFPDDVKKEFHLCTADAVKLIKEIKPKLAIITHFGVKMLQADPINEARKIQKETNVQTIAAKDGMVINPVSYSVNLRQKTLKMF